MSTREDDEAHGSDSIVSHSCKKRNDGQPSWLINGVVRPEKLCHPPNVAIIVMIPSGWEGSYEWLVTDEEFDLLQLCPEIVVAKYVAVISIDSREVVPTEKETMAGWHRRAKIAYSPKIENVQDLPCGDWDEWYIFNSPTDLGTSHLAENIFEVPHEQGHVSDFVNYGFALHPPERAAKLSTIFWPQSERIRPESYIADNEYLTFVSANKHLFASVDDAVKAIC